jgi:hypothetical protein
VPVVVVVAVKKKESLLVEFESRTRIRDPVL